MKLYSKTNAAAAAVGLAALAVLAACGPSMPAYDYTSEPDPRRTEYVLGVSDEIQITVWKQSELTTGATIRPDGTITMPLVGDLQAAGRTPSELKAEIETKLRDFVKIAGSEISIAVVSANSYRYTVSGEVVRPGIFTSSYYVTVAEAIAQAGGFTRFAKKNKIVIMRRDLETGEIRRIPIVYELIANGAHQEMNLVILAGDSIHVP